MKKEKMQIHFENEPDPQIRFDLLDICDTLANQYNFDKEKDPYVREEMIRTNKKLANQYNFKKEEDEEVKKEMIKYNSSIITKRRTYCLLRILRIVFLVIFLK